MRRCPTVIDPIVGVRSFSFGRIRERRLNHGGFDDVVVGCEHPSAAR
jgi:hypothetical protein